MMHVSGARPDEVAYRIAGYLPSYDKLTRFLLIDTTWLACRLSGYRGSLLSYPGKRPSTLMTMMSHRTDFFDRSVRDALMRTEKPARQLIVLGAGYDTRCFDLPDGIDARCFEVDMAPTLRAKQRALAAAGVSCDHVTFVETDFNQERWTDAVSAAGFDPSVTTYILWEGVTMYLVEQAVIDTLEFVATLPAGSAIGLDVFAKALVEGEPPYERLSRMMHNGIRYYSEDLLYGVSAGEGYSEGLEELARRCGLTIARFEYVGSEADKTPPFYYFAELSN